MVKRYKEVFDPNRSQECICHRGPMNRGLEESPDGDFVDIEDYEELKKQLAKANERVAELEDKHLNLVLWHNLDPQQAKLYSDKYASKFAIENQVKGAEALMYAFPLNASDQMKKWVEQLRKKQDDGQQSTENFRKDELVEIIGKLREENALLKEQKHDAYYAERNWNELHGDES